MKPSIYLTSAQSGKAWLDAYKLIFIVMFLPITVTYRIITDVHEYLKNAKT
jgi:hypothetical protein